MAWNITNVVSFQWYELLWMHWTVLDYLDMVVGTFSAQY